MRVIFAMFYSFICIPSVHEFSWAFMHGSMDKV